MRDLQRVFEDAPGYYERTTGVPPGPAEAQSTYTILPEGKGWLMAEFGADKREDALDLAHHAMDTLKSKPGARVRSKARLKLTMGLSNSPRS